MPDPGTLTKIDNLFAMPGKETVVPDAPPSPAAPDARPTIEPQPTEPRPVLVPGLHPLKAEAEHLEATGGSADGGTSTATQPSPPIILPEAPPNTLQPSAQERQSFMQAKAIPQPKPIDVPKYDTAYHFQTPTPTERPHFFENMTRGAGQLVSGIGGGGVQVADTLKALVEVPGRLGKNDPQNPVEPWRRALPTNTYDSWQTQYENAQGKGTVDSGPYKVGKAIGEMGAYAATSIGVGAAAVGLGAPAAVGAAAGLGAAALEGGIVGIGQSAQDQLRRGGKQLVNGGELLGSGAVGAAFGLGGGAVGLGIKSLVGRAMKAYQANRAVKGASTGTEALDKEALQRQLDSENALEGIKRDLNNHEAEQLENFHKTFNTPPPPENALQRKQIEALEKAKAVDPMTAQPPNAPFRLRVRKIGYEIIDDALDISEVKPLITPATFKKLKEAVTGLGEAKALLGHVENDLEAYARNALKVAKTAGQRAKILVKETTRLKSTAQRELSKLKDKLYTEQQQELKAQTEALRDTLTAEMESSPRKFRAALQAQIRQLDETLQGLSDPAQFYKIGSEKHTYVIANRHELESPNVPRELAPRFSEAFEQFTEATNQFKAAEKKLDNWREHIQPILEQAELEYQRAMDDFESRLWLKVEITNPYSRKVTTDMGVGLNHDSFVARLNGWRHEELKLEEAALMKIEANIVKEITYKHADIANMPKQTNKEAMDVLRKMGALHPIAEQLGKVMALGLISLDAMPADAADNQTPKEQKHFLGNIAFGATAIVLAGKYGVPMARKLIRTPSYYFLRAYANTMDLCKFADSALGISPALHGGASLYKNLNELGGKVTEAITMCPDYTEYMMQSLRKQIDGKELSEKARGYVTEIQDLVASIKEYLPRYVKAWAKHYEGLSQADKDYLKPVNEGVHFVNDTFNKSRHAVLGDSAFGRIFAHSTRAIFTWRPKTFISQVLDVAIGGPLQVGHGAVATAHKAYATNMVLKGMLDRQVKSGSMISQSLSEVSEHAKPLLAEQIQNRLMLLASLFHYYETHPVLMRAIGETDREKFAIRVLSDGLQGTVKMPTPKGVVELPLSDVKADVFIQAHVDLASVIGADPLMLTYDWMGRTPAGFFIRWASQPMRYSRLLATAALPGIAEPGMQPTGSMVSLARLMLTQGIKGNVPWIVASLGVLWQVGGQAAIPKSLQLAGWHYAPTQTANVIAFLNATSIGQHLLGDMSSSVDYDPIFAPLMGSVAPGLDNAIKLATGAGDLTDHMGDVVRAINGGVILNAAMQGDIDGVVDASMSAPERAFRTFTANKANEDAENAQRALYIMLNDISVAIPELGIVPTQALAAFLYHLPEVIHGNLRVSVPNPAIGNHDKFPLEGGKVMRFHPREGETQDDADNRARIAGLYRMLRLGDTLDVTNFKNARTGVHYQGRPNEDLQRLQQNSL